ncbi:hypothetical protein [Shimazuella alba]|uniref:Uncharacterized protein n=1 Tax=Shimazuella alba TaxID=2690964 RepID=A0A6I4VQP8_9BACL|nr:hypothetical protein [Shimazuella alba]MXQ53977.1 hypothetical protein [Shimazuella alba]
MYPTKKQAISIHKFNHFLAKWNDTYRKRGKGSPIRFAPSF